MRILLCHRIDLRRPIDELRKLKRADLPYDSLDLANAQFVAVLDGDDGYIYKNTRSASSGSVPADAIWHFIRKQG